MNARKTLQDMGALGVAELLRATFDAKLVYLTDGKETQGNSVVNGDDLMVPGCVWTEYVKPKVKK